MKQILSFLLSLLINIVVGLRISGFVIDETGAPIPAANIVIDGYNWGTSTDLDGKFAIEIPDFAIEIPDTHNIPAQLKLRVSAVGFSSVEKSVSIFHRGDLKFILKSEAVIADPIIVTASRTEQNILDSPISIAVEPADKLQARAFSGIDESVKYVSGVSLNKYQLSVRGCSGFSQGAGSRVLVLVDNLPCLAGDTGEIKWDALPISSTQQVELVKGAGSALYGSGALGGVMNIITKEPEKNTISVWTKCGVFDEPMWKEWDWSSKILKFGGIGGEISRKTSWGSALMTLDFAQSDGYRKNDDFKRTRIFYKAKLEISPLEKLTALINLAYEDRGNFFMWANQWKALEPPREREQDRVWSTKAFGGTKYEIDNPSKKTFSKFILSWSYSDWTSKLFSKWDTLANGDSVRIFNDEYSRSFKLGADWQLTKVWGNHYITGVAELNGVTISSKTFKSHIGYGGSFFVQDEFSFDIYNIKTTITGSFRGDLFKVDSASGNGIYAGPSFRCALTLRPNNTKLSIRTGINSAFRNPTMAELFTKTYIAGLIAVKPNPSLASELGYTAELGATYLWHDLYLDGAIFVNYFYDMIEPVMGGFSEAQFQNVTEARIVGGEITAKKTAKIFELSGSYTYLMPENLETNEILPYRSKHSTVISISAKPTKWITLGTDWRYNSAPIYAFNPREQVVDRKILDVFATVKLPRVEIAIRTNNVLNYNYTEIDGNLGPIRNYTLSLRWDIQ